MILRFNLTDGDSVFIYGVIVGVHGYIITETDCVHSLSDFGDTEELRYTWSDDVESVYTAIGLGDILERSTPVPIKDFVHYWGVKGRVFENYQLLLESVKEIGADLTQFPEWGERKMTKQPEWKLVGQIGDCNPVDYSGGYVFVDTTGVYPPEVEWIENINQDDEDKSPIEVYRFTLENCFYTNGILSDNEFHKDHPVWFADDVEALADQFGEKAEWLIEKFCSDDPMERAWAWQEVGMYLGWDELDNYPLRMTYAEAEERYSQEKYK